MVDDVVLAFEHAVREPVVADELPDIFNRVQFGTFRRQRRHGDVGRDDEVARKVPAGLIDQQGSVSVRRDPSGDFGEMQAHRLSVATGQDQSGSLALDRTNCTEDIC